LICREKLGTTTPIFEKKLGYNEGSFLSELPVGLRKEVSLFLKRDMIQKIRLFKNIDDSFLREVSLQMKLLVFTPGDFIFKKGDVGKEMYFVIRGILEVNSEDGAVNELKDGHFFGEIALVKNVNRTASVKEFAYSDLYVLEKDVFNRLLIITQI